MILAIDIGNTSIALGGFVGEELKFVVRLSTDVTKTEDEYASKILNILSLHGVERSNVELKYSKCSATATITPDGKVVSYETMVNANMILRDAKVKIINTDLDATLYSLTKYYNINW